jgi:hypothetical protein
VCYYGSIFVRKERIQAWRILCFPGLFVCLLLLLLLSMRRSSITILIHSVFIYRAHSTHQLLDPCVNFFHSLPNPIHSSEINLPMRIHFHHRLNKTFQYCFGLPKGHVYIMRARGVYGLCLIVSIHYSSQLSHCNLPYICTNKTSPPCIHAKLKTNPHTLIGAYYIIVKLRAFVYLRFVVSLLLDLIYEI